MKLRETRRYKVSASSDVPLVNITITIGQSQDDQRLVSSRVGDFEIGRTKENLLTNLSFSAMTGTGFAPLTLPIFEIYSETTLDNEELEFFAVAKATFRGADLVIANREDFRWERVHPRMAISANLGRLDGLAFVGFKNWTKQPIP